MNDDRRSLLARLAGRSSEELEPHGAHPIPAAADRLPPIVVSTLDPGDLTGSFVQAARAVGATVHVVATARELGPVAADIVERHGVRRAVASKQHEVWPAVEVLGALGAEVTPFDRTAAAAADLGISAATAAIAATGTIAQHSDLVGGRTVSLLPRVHWCIVPASRIVADTATVFSTSRERGLPSNLVLVTGPSKSADIEQIIVTGVHGPVALELTVVLAI